ncbi:MAG: PA0069 family radical SAM protein [Thermoanaerobaculia bacterium]
MQDPGESRRHGRGATINPSNRFERLHYEPDPESVPEPDLPPLDTRLFRDPSRSLITTNDSPDVPFTASINPYRGCEHGCIYCFARPTHEYLGFSAGLDFESRIMVKEDAPEILRSELSAKKWTPQVIAISGVTDAYQPVERRLRITRRCLEVLADFRNPVAIVTKNHLVTRDIDLLAKLAALSAAAVFISITTLDPELARRMEPRASTPELRIRAIRELTDAGVPTGVLTAPVIPAINDHEIPQILEAAARAGAVSASYTVLRLPWSVKELFAAWLDEHFPDRKEKVLGRIRELREGKLNGVEWNSRLKGEGEYARQIGALFHAASRRAGLGRRSFELSTAAFRLPPGPQRSLFGDQE